MLPGNEAPFPENQTCKLCIARPCKRLFSGRVYPGKMIFVHHGDFLSWPCHTPVLKPEADEEDVAALTDDLVVTTGKVTVTNPRWEHVNEVLKADFPDAACAGDKICLLVDVTGIPDGAPVTFDIYDVSSEPPFRIATAKGKNEKGAARGEWTVEDPNKIGQGLKLEFEGVAKSKASVRAEIGTMLKFEFSS